jgi:hypothetical protein
LDGRRFEDWQKMEDFLMANASAMTRPKEVRKTRKASK